MSEMVDELLAQLPEQCRTCPVIGRVAMIAAGSESQAQDTSDLMTTLIDSSCSPNLGMSKLLSDESDLEIEATAALRSLVNNTDGACPGARRGIDVKGSSLFMKVIDLLKGEKTCLNPQFAELQEMPLVQQASYSHWKPEK